MTRFQHVARSGTLGDSKLEVQQTNLPPGMAPHTHQHEDAHKFGIKTTWGKHSLCCQGLGGSPCRAIGLAVPVHQASRPVSTGCENPPARQREGLALPIPRIPTGRARALNHPCL